MFQEKIGVIRQTKRKNKTKVRQFLTAKMKDETVKMKVRGKESTDVSFLEFRESFVF